MLQSHLIIFGYSFPVVDKDDLQSLWDVEFHIRFLAAFILDYV